MSRRCGFAFLLLMLCGSGPGCGAAPPPSLVGTWTEVDVGAQQAIAVWRFDAPTGEAGGAFISDKLALPQDPEAADHVFGGYLQRDGWLTLRSTSVRDREQQERAQPYRLLGGTLALTCYLPVGAVQGYLGTWRYDLRLGPAEAPERVFQSELRLQADGAAQVQNTVNGAVLPAEPWIWQEEAPGRLRLRLQGTQAKVELALQRLSEEGDPQGVLLAPAVLQRSGVQREASPALTIVGSQDSQ